MSIDTNGLGAAVVSRKYYPEERADYRLGQEVKRDREGYELCAEDECETHAVHFTGFCHEHAQKRRAGIYGISRWQAFLDNSVPVERLEDWELVRGVALDPKQRMNAGRRSSRQQARDMVPLDQYRAMVAELFKRHDEKLRGMADDAINTLYEIMTNDANEPADRIKAATWIYERVRGKTAETLKLQVDSTEPWQQVIEGIARVTRQEAMQQNTIEGEIVAISAAEVENTPKTPQQAVQAAYEPPLDAPESATDAQARADERAARIAAEKERRTKARNRRYAARAQGWDSADDAQPIVQGNKVIEPEDFKSPEPKRDYRD